MNSMCFEPFKPGQNTVNQDYKVVSHEFDVFQNFQIRLNHK